MKHEFTMSMTAIATFGIGVLLYMSTPSEWVPEISNFISPSEPILIVVVGSPEIVRTVRRAISNDRVATLHALHDCWVRALGYRNLSVGRRLRLSS